MGWAPDEALPRDADNPFWDFSLAVYGRAGVASACLALQDRRGADVNLLLYSAWAGLRGRALSPADLQRLMAAARPWQEQVIAPLRDLRRRLPAVGAAPDTLLAALRERLKAAELAAEAVEQQVLFDAFALGDGLGAAALSGGNLTAYLRALRVRPDAADAADMAAILCGCYPDLPPAQTLRAVTG